MLYRLKPNEPIWPRRGLFVCPETRAWYVFFWCRIPFARLEDAAGRPFNRPPAAWLRLSVEWRFGIALHWGLTTV
jgi:hypothetical protein